MDHFLQLFLDCFYIYIIVCFGRYDLGTIISSIQLLQKTLIFLYSMLLTKLFNFVWPSGWRHSWVKNFLLKHIAERIQDEILSSSKICFEMCCEMFDIEKCVFWKTLKYSKANNWINFENNELSVNFPQKLSVHKQAFFWK